ncbi:hypothetical protein LUZ60_002352 [Juncus effusus]|nr:hypothetical protein LUZ60_002352 [Juncus effusus]
MVMENCTRTRGICCFLSLVFFVTTVSAQATSLPSIEGFISLDCGILDNQNYTDNVTHLPYTSDSQYIDTGKIKNISADYITSTLPKYNQTVRFFPDGDRNCYTFENMSAGYYLARATFFHGNYNGSQSVQPGKPIVFDLYLRANLWTNVNISDASKEFMFEATLYASSSYILFVCLVNTNSGVPFISALEIRPFDQNSAYSYNTNAKSFMHRLNYGDINQTIRYPDDKYDRIWQPYHNSSVWTNISTNLSITPPTYDYFSVPIPVLQTAVTPTNSPDLTVIKWKSEILPPKPLYYFAIHFAEIQLTNSSTREFIVEINGKQWSSTAFRSSYLQEYSFFCYEPLDKADEYTLKLSKTTNSTLSPLVNAVEVYSDIQQDNFDTYSDDMKAIMAIKKSYGLTKNWVGDPCSPSKYKWNGLNCTYDNLELNSYINSINLASSGLKGEISDSFKSLQSLENLPGSNKCGEKQTPGKDNKKIVIAVSVASAVLLAILILIMWKICQRKHGFSSHVSLSTPMEGSRAKREDNRLHVNFQQFTYDQLKLITNNFSEVIGQGGFGIVYRGLIDNEIEVAIKVPTVATTAVMKQFLSEAKNLMQVHHRNLVTFIGYCMDQNCHGLVYEYMPNGSLHDHLTNKTEASRVLNWGERLSISFESAQGLDYLHTGCMIAHRDVKSSNILLGPNFEAKVADFGLSKMFNASTGISTITLCGTPGYIDPEIHRSPLSERSDVYSFGVVLLEIITGKPALAADRENVNLVDHVKRTLATGNISDIVDSRLESDYNEKIVWKIIDLAIRCTKETSLDRPIMAEVVMQLRDCISEENRWRSRDINREGGLKSQASSITFSLVGMGPTVR